MRRIHAFAKVNKNTNLIEHSGVGITTEQTGIMKDTILVTMLVANTHRNGTATLNIKYLNNKLMQVAWK